MTTAFALPIEEKPRIGGVSGWLVVFALLFNVLLPITQVKVQQAQAAAGIEKVILCSAHGLIAVTFKDGAPIDTDPSKAEHIAKANCAICSAAMGHAVLPLGIELTVSGTVTTVLYRAASHSTPARGDFKPPQARAPPAII